MSLYQSQLLQETGNVQISDHYCDHKNRPPLLGICSPTATRRPEAAPRQQQPGSRPTR
jgi:hypothetical protein